MGRPCAAPPGCVRTGARTRHRAFRRGPDGWLGGRFRLWPGCAGAKFGWPSEGRNRRLVRGRTSRSSGLGTCDGRPASGATVNYSPYAASGPGSSTTSERGGVETRTPPSFGPLKRVRTVSVRANTSRDQSVRPLRLRDDPSGPGFARLRSDRLPSPPDLRQFPSSSQPLSSATRVPRETCRWRRWRR